MKNKKLEHMTGEKREAEGKKGAKNLSERRKKNQ
jgi:hypothetical protein